MKKLIILAYFTLLSISLTNAVFATNNTFARINSQYSYLYSTASTKIENNVICILDYSYFVEITLDYDDNFYKVIYGSENGYVLKTSVTKVLGTPKSPYPTTSIKTKSSKCYLRSSPTENANNIVTVIPENCTDLKYIGKIYGEEAIDYKGNLWYYVNFFGVNGYVYSEYILSIATIAKNNEDLDSFSSLTKSTPSPLTNFECTLIVTILSIPIILIVIIMYKPLKPAKNVTKKLKSKKITKSKNYEDDLL